MRHLKHVAAVGVEQVSILDLSSGEVTGPGRGRFVISEELLPKLQFLREGHFVDVEGAPALRLIGQLEPMEGTIFHASIEVPRSIHEEDIIGAFLRRDAISSPLDYLKAVCRLSSPLSPLYFFIERTNHTFEEVGELLLAMPIRGKVRAKIVERLNTERESFVQGTVTGIGQGAIERNRFLEGFRTKTINDAEVQANLIRFFEAVTHTNGAEFHCDYIANLILMHVLPNFTKLSGSQLTLFRKAVCHLDVQLFRDKL